MITDQLNVQAPVSERTERPIADPVEPRTKRHDWVFVGYPRGTRPVRNDPATDLYVEDEVEISRALAALLKRDDVRARYPYIFLAPAVVPAFKTAVVAHQL